jgi:hypothetical protein
MVTFRNNNVKRNNFRRNGRNDRNFKSNGERKFSSGFSNNENFQRKIPGRNNHNAPKLIEKYNNLAREALSAGDKILSENYFQHADHFTRILAEQENYKKSKYSTNSQDANEVKDNDKKIEDTLDKTKNLIENTEKPENI